MGFAPAEYLGITSNPERLADIADIDLDNAQLREDLDGLARRASEQTGHPVSMINIILDNAQLTLGSHGLPDMVRAIGGLPTEWTFCVHTVLARGACVIPDARSDHRFDANPFVGLGLATSYAGIPLLSAHGKIIGTYCVLDDEAGTCSGRDVDILHTLSQDVIDIIDSHRIAGSDRR